MELLLFHMLIYYGLTAIIVDSKIVKPFREYLKSKNEFLKGLLGCYQCTGFWIGALIFLVMPYTNFILLDMIFSSASALLLDSIREKLNPDW